MEALSKPGERQYQLPLIYADHAATTALSFRALDSLRALLLSRLKDSGIRFLVNGSENHIPGSLSLSFYHAEGLRHSYAAEKYRQFTENGMSGLDAHFIVSRLLGHERPDVTDIYLASVKKEERHGD